MTTEGKWRPLLHEVVFEADTASGKVFDVALIWMILASVAAVMLESVPAINAKYGSILRVAEWTFTISFTVEYVVRLYAVHRPLKYAVSFFGIVDLLSILPTYLSLLFPGGQALASVRALRLLRVFRVLKLAHHVKAAAILIRALKASRTKITVFMLAVLTLVTILGSAVYLLEGPSSGFTSIPKSVYWAIVTLTTVGYGDITPQTTMGQAVAAVVMIMGYAIIAVPTGIVTAELTALRSVSTQACPHCSSEGHDPDARHCKFCGEAL